MCRRGSWCPALHRGGACTAALRLPGTTPALGACWQPTRPVAGCPARFQWWRDGLSNMFAGHAPRHPVLLALQEVGMCLAAGAPERGGGRGLPGCWHCSRWAAGPALAAGRHMVAPARGGGGAPASRCLLRTRAVYLPQRQARPAAGRLTPRQSSPARLLPPARRCRRTSGPLSPGALPPPAPGPARPPARPPAPAGAPADAPEQVPTQTPAGHAGVGRVVRAAAADAGPLGAVCRGHGVAAAVPAAGGSRCALVGAVTAVVSGRGLCFCRRLAGSRRLHWSLPG